MNKPPPRKRMKKSPGASKEDLDEDLDFLKWKDYMKKEQTKLVALWADKDWVEFWAMAKQQEISPTVDTVVDVNEALRHKVAILIQRQGLSQPSNSDGFHEFCIGCDAKTTRSAKYISDPSGESFPLCQECFKVYKDEVVRDWTRGGFFFNKKKTRKRRKKKTKGKKKKKRKSKKKKKKTRKKKDIKFTDTSYPYRMITKKVAIEDFNKLREMIKKGDFNSKSILGNRTVDFGTEKMRKKTKYRNKSHYERWQDKTSRDRVIKFAKRLYNQKHKRTVKSSIRSAIELQWGSINTMRPAAASCSYRKNKATKVLDFTAGWGARLIGAMAMDIDYIGIDANTELKPGYDKIIKALTPYSKSTVKMIYKKAETVDFSKLKYDFVFTSPPYEYLEVYENMENYEKKGEKVSQPYSSSKIKIDDSGKFYDEFMIPTLKKIYNRLPKGKYICLNMPDIMYTKIKKKWKKADKKDVYSIAGRVGGPEDFKRLEKEQIFCWKKH